MKFEHMSTPFSQADSSTLRLHEVTGIGLSISIWLVEKVGGNIAVESAASEGQSFIASSIKKKQHGCCDYQQWK